MCDLYVWGVEACSPGNVWKLDALRLVLRPFGDRSRAHSQSIASNFLLSMYAFAKSADSNSMRG